MRRRNHLSKWLLSLLLTTTGVVAHADAKTTLPQNPPPLPVVQKELKEAEQNFAIAKKMFNPWYAGPLITPGATNAPPGTFVIQPYLFSTWTYGQFTSNRKSISIPTIYQLKTQFVFQTGLLSWLDFTIAPSGSYNRQSGETSTHWGDTPISLGIPLMKEQPYKPNVRFTVTESFPTGRYERLSAKKNGIDATGTGAYGTSFAINMSKVIWWISDHPFKVRGSLNYGFSVPTNVSGFNAYGGGYGTKGKVRPGNNVAIDGSFEWSFNQKWVLASDFVYTYQNHSTFSGKKGVDTKGKTASVGTPSNDQFSIAPAIEYNPKDNLGFLLGGWVAVTGRNSSNFASAVLTMYYSW